MKLPCQLQVGLKEWDVVCQAMGDGRQMLLLRKGGISESVGGFEIEHRSFLFFPTFVHQNPQMLKPADRAGISSVGDEPAQITLRFGGVITDIVQVANRVPMDRLDTQHIWAPPLIDMRFNYRPTNPLYLLIVRVFNLITPVTVPNLPNYAGCKSWVPLANPVPVQGLWAIDDSAFESRRQHILATFKA